MEVFEAVRTVLAVREFQDTMPIHRWLDGHGHALKVQRIRLG